MSFGNLLFDLQAPARNFVRLIEKKNKKIVDKKYALVFNQTYMMRASAIDALLEHHTGDGLLVGFHQVVSWSTRLKVACESLA
jgi:hypothetical protein